MLLVDVGNTRLKWGVWRDRKLSNFGAADYADQPLVQVLAAAWTGLPSPERIIVSNVAGTAFREALEAICRTRYHRSPEFLQARARACGVTNGYQEPGQLGVDRWAALVAAYHLYKDKAPVCIIGCGTAITVDTVTPDGRHLGGLIAPGLGVMQRALATAAPAIPHEAGTAATLYARDTRSAVTSGVLYAATGMIERVTREIRTQQGDQTQFLLTGGDAQQLQPLLNGRYTLVPHLVLEGLALLADEQT